MTPNSLTLSSVEVFVVYGVVSVLMAATICLWICYANEKRRRLFDQEMHRRRLVQLERGLAFFTERDRLAEAVRLQRADTPTVTLPVTHCERRDRRRRFLPLESNTDGTG